MDIDNNFVDNGIGGVMELNPGFSTSPPGLQAWLGEVPPHVDPVEQLAYSVEGEYLPLMGDIDIDGDVDLDDYGLFADCMSGPDVTDPPIGCDPVEFTRSDLHDDGDVDLHDFAEFQQVFGQSLP